MKYFAKVNWGDASRFFNRDMATAEKILSELLEESYVAHYWNDVTRRIDGDLLGMEQLISRLANLHCPVTAHAAAGNFWGMRDARGSPGLVKRRRR